MTDPQELPNPVTLPLGWRLTFDWRYGMRDDLNGPVPQGFVLGPKGESASLAFALETGTNSDNDEKIPQPVLDALEEYEEEYA